MAFSFPMQNTSGNSPSDSRRSSASSGRYEDFYREKAALHRTMHGTSWSSHACGAIRREYPTAGYISTDSQTPRSADTWTRRTGIGLREYPIQPTWQSTKLGSQLVPAGQSMTGSPSSPSNSYSRWSNSMPGPLLRRISSEDVPLSELHQAYDTIDMSSSVPDLQTRAFHQRRSSNRDEFDGPSQFLTKPEGVTFEPREEELPILPVTLYAQEQDDILAQVNDRLSKCAFDFIAKYQFPIPIEADKRPVRVAHDREWQEWVYLLKRLATKRRIPARVLYNGQIKQFITILENSIEMRHAAKHQSRPLKDDRNLLQLISSGLQVAKILKDAPAMRFLDDLYAQTESRIQERRTATSLTTIRGTRSYETVQ